MGKGTRLTESELARLKACKSVQEWNDICDSIKVARNGEYPVDWLKAHIIMRQVRDSWS